MKRASSAYEQEKCPRTIERALMGCFPQGRGGDPTRGLEHFWASTSAVTAVCCLVGFVAVAVVADQYRAQVVPDKAAVR